MKKTKWIKLSDRMPNLEERRSKVLIYELKNKIVYFANAGYLDFKNKENILWQKLELPKED